MCNLRVKSAFMELEGPLAGIRVVETAGWNGVLAGRLMADAGARTWVRAKMRNSSVRLRHISAGAEILLFRGWCNLLSEKGDHVVGCRCPASHAVVIRAMPAPAANASHAGPASDSTAMR